MDKIVYKLQEFEGPLDLLLYLISKHKLDIYDIQISLLLEQYLLHIETMENLDMNISSEFLEMAAKLVYMKTVSLLPKNEEIEELKKELTGQLIEYQECKEIAKLLSQQLTFDSFVREPKVIDFDMTYKNTHNIKDLLSSYMNMVGKGKRNLPPSKERFSGIVSRKIVSITSKIIYILKKLIKKNELNYNSIFESINKKSELIATFLAMLELVKGKRIRVEDNNTYTKVKLINGKVKRNWMLDNYKQQ